VKEEKGRVLIIDSEQTSLTILSAILEADGFWVCQVNGIDRAITVLDNEIIDTIITEMKMPGKTGLDLLCHVKSQHPHIPIIFLTAYGTIEAAVNAMTSGAYHYFVKPPDYQQLKIVLARAAEQGRLKREVARMRKRHEQEFKSSMLLGKSLEMQRIFDMVQSVKDSSSSVLICGETGTGKELIARLLHFSSKRSHMPFVAVNCAAIPRDLIEAELFGHEKGAFTGAIQRRVGRIEAAGGGTLFLDEISELDIAVQSKLLRVLQEKEFSRLGDNSSIQVDFRLITSTNQVLAEEIEKGKFRKDLFYRLNVVCINVPPLRERKEDIQQLMQTFMDEFCSREEKVLYFKSDVLKALKGYSWPGNVRELKNVIEGVVALAKRRNVTIDDLPEAISVDRVSLVSEGSVRTLKELEASTIQDVLLQCDGNKSRVAKLLGISRKTLYKRISEK
jgi:DNA-binding NtrC family response regulator